MKIFTSFAISLLLLFGFSAQAADSRWTFDGDIRNNTLAVSPNEKTAAVGNSDTPIIYIYDLKTSEKQAMLSGFVTPRNILFSPDGEFLYISDSSLGVIFKFDATNFKLLTKYTVGPGAFGTAINNDGSKLYINNQAANTVTVFDLQKEKPAAVITGFAQPRQGVILSPNGQTLYVTNFASDKITVVDLGSNEIVGEIDGFDKIRAISVTSDGKTIFAANSGNNKIAVVDAQAMKVIDTIKVGKEPYGAALTPDEKFVYSGNLADNSLTVIALPDMKVITTVTGLKEPRQAIAFSQDSKTAYVLNGDLSIAKVDLTTNEVVVN